MVKMSTPSTPDMHGLCQNYTNSLFNSSGVGIAVTPGTGTAGWAEMCTNNLTWIDEYNPGIEELSLERIVSRVVPVFFGLIGLAGLLGNALVVLVVAANPGMRSTTNLLIINLAVADLLFVIFCVPFTATDYVLTRWPFGDAWCKLVQYLIVVTVHASVYTLVLMSLDRFLAVVHPVASMALRTERNAIRAIGLAWVLILTTAAPVAYCHGEVQYWYQGRPQSSCVFLEGDSCKRPAFQLSFLASAYAVPLALICGLYVRLLARLWRAAPGGRLSAEGRRGKRRVTRMVLVVVAAFAFCWLPIHGIMSCCALSFFSQRFGHRCRVQHVCPHDGNCNAVRSLKKKVANTA